MSCPPGIEREDCPASLADGWEYRHGPQPGTSAGCPKHAPRQSVASRWWQAGACKGRHHTGAQVRLRAEGIPRHKTRPTDRLASGQLPAPEARSTAWGPSGCKRRGTDRGTRDHEISVKSVHAALSAGLFVQVAAGWRARVPLGLRWLHVDGVVRH